MRNQILVKRYGQGLVGALKNEAEYQAVMADLSDFLNLLLTREELWQALCLPILATSKKIQIAKDILARKSYPEKTAKFLLLLLEHKRLDLLKEIVRDLPVFWKSKQGIVTFEVRSVVPLSDSQKKKLEKELELLEKKPVYLTYSIDSELVGGLYLRKGNVVYDVSLRGYLARLKEIIGER